MATRRELRNKLEEQQYKCALSGRPLDPDTAALDHITPSSEGGSDDISNLQWVHKDVNKAKGNMSVDQFIAICNDVATNALF